MSASLTNRIADLSYVEQGKNAQDLNHTEVCLKSDQFE